MLAIEYPTKEQLLPLLKNTPDHSLDFVLIITGIFEQNKPSRLIDITFRIGSFGMRCRNDAVGAIDARYYCLRTACIRKRKVEGVDDKEPLTDFWWNVHRVKHRRHRDYHPCHLPDKLLERIIL